MPAGRPPKFTSPDEMEALAELYFMECEGKNEPILITGVARALGIVRDTLTEYGKQPEFSAAVKRIKQRAEEYAEKQLFMGRNAAGPIFALKNHGWHDKQELQHTGANGGPIQTEELSAKDVARRMLLALAKADQEEDKSSEPA